MRRALVLVYVEMIGPGNRLGLTAIRAGASATYVTKPHFEGNRVRASFGRLGSLDLSFTPTPGKVHRCGSIVDAQGTFTGRLEFTGENRYIHFDIRRVKGEHTTAGSCPSSRAVGASAPPRVALRAEEPGATLIARAAGPSGRDTLTAEVYRGVRGFEGVIAGFRWEHREGVEISRGAQIGIGRN